MASVNKWIGIGNLGSDPEVRNMQNGDVVCNMSIACTYSYKDKATSEKKEVTEWVRIVMFRKLAEIAGQYLRKGAKVYIEGRLQTRKWQDKEGNDRYSTEVVANEMQMLDSRSSDAGYSAPQGSGNAPSAAAPRAQTGARKSLKDEWEAPAAAPSDGDDFDEDQIPFS